MVLLGACADNSKQASRLQIDTSSLDSETLGLLKSIDNNPNVIALLEQKAVSGDVGAQTLLGFLLIDGRKVKKDVAKGLNYFRQAADSGDVTSAIFLGKFLSRPNSPWTDHEEAKKWLAAASNSTQSPSKPDRGEHSSSVNINWKRILDPGIPVKSTGSAVAINNTGVFLTNRHVVKDCSFIAVRYNGQYGQARVHRPYDALDIAVLHVGEATPYFLRLAPSLAPLGERIYAGGYPLTELTGSQLKITEGLVSGLDRAGKGEIQISASVSSGNSGGPVVDSSGRLVGLATWGVDPSAAAKTPVLIGHGLNFAVHAEYAKTILAAKEVRYAVQANERSLDSKEIARVLKATTGLVLCH